MDAVLVPVLVCMRGGMREVAIVVTEQCTAWTQPSLKRAPQVAQSYLRCIHPHVFIGADKRFIQHHVG